MYNIQPYKQHMKKLLLSTLFLSVASALPAQVGGTYKGHSKYIQAVDEYVPAPGQFVNSLPAYEEGDDAKAMAAKCTDRLANGKMEIVSLGAYGGYITFHFDHSIVNVPGQNDFYIAGNAAGNGAEPGIVMVSKDVNGNGLPDDPWYELQGSADVDSIGKVVYGYEITYTKDAMNNVPWTDNQGNSGTVDRNGYHKQEYFPLWLESPLAFKGTLLPKKGIDQNGKGTNWALKALRYGYVDNLPNNDSIANSFNIEWAVDGQRVPVQLDAVDFVRVYSAENQKAGWLGETSTEVCGAEDLHLQASVEAASVATFEDVAVDDKGYTLYRPETVEDMEYYEGSISSGQYKFNATYMEWSGTPVWSGFAVADMKDNTYAELDDQYKNAKGGGYKSDNYAVAYTYGGCSVDVPGSGEGTEVSGFYLNNSAWAVDAILKGDGMTEGGFTTGDWFKLTVTGVNANGNESTKDVYLADYRSENTADHYYISDWTWVDLSALGAVTSVKFALSSSRNNSWGMTTPSYFCLDNFGGKDDGTSTGITRAPSQSAAKAVSRYTVDGKCISAPQRGLNLVRMSDGSVRKVMVK